MMPIIFLAAIIIIALSIILYFVPLGLWIAAMSSGAYVGIGTLIAMRLRRVPPHRIVNPRISAVKAGLNPGINDLDGTVDAQGDLDDLAVLLTLVTGAAAALWVGARPTEILSGWYDGFWMLLEFGMQMVLILSTGYAVALSPPVA